MWQSYWQTLFNYLFISVFVSVRARKKKHKFLSHRRVYNIQLSRNRKGRTTYTKYRRNVLNYKHMGFLLLLYIFLIKKNKSAVFFIISTYIINLLLLLFVLLKNEISFLRHNSKYLLLLYSHIQRQMKIACLYFTFHIFIIFCL